MAYKIKRTIENDLPLIWRNPVTRCDLPSAHSTHDELQGTGHNGIKTSGHPPALPSERFAFS
jgi:hypothetical protein